MFELESYVPKARDILRRVPLIDGHNDWPHLIRGFYDNIIEDVSFDCGKSLVGQVDMQRLRKGLVGGVFLSAYVDCPTEDDFSVDAHLPAHLETMQQIDLIYRLIDKYSDHLVVAPRASDIQPIFHSGKIAVMIGVEGLHQIANSPGVLRMYYRLGTAPGVHGGLSLAGKDIIKEMNRVGLMIDLSHASESTMQDALKLSRAPVIFSHSSAYSVCPHRRNVPDSILRLLQANGGIIMITLVPDHTDLDAPNASLFHVVDHIRHVGKLIGYDHVGIGSDFDGMARAVQGVEDVGQYPNLVAAMLMKGMAESDVEKVLGLNLIRVLAEVEKVASEYFQQFPALEEAIPQLWNDDIRAFAQSVYPHAEGPRKRRDKGV